MSIVGRHAKKLFTSTLLPSSSAVSKPLSFGIEQQVGFEATNHTLTSRRYLTSEAARSLLNLAPKRPVVLSELREAYFAAAKLCHPDVAESKDDSHDEFLKLTAAYELLQREALKGRASEMESLITYTEEQEFREACKIHLGLPAEIVEECKQNPSFRRWLGGRTDAAQTWRDFFVQNGGLAPKLPQSIAYIDAGGNHKLPNSETRRKRRLG